MNHNINPDTINNSLHMMNGTRHIYEINAFIAIVFLSIGFISIISIYYLIKNKINKKEINSYNNYNYCIFLFSFVISYFFTYALIKFNSFELLIFDSDSDQYFGNVILKYFSFLYVLIFNGMFIGSYIFNGKKIKESFVAIFVYLLIGVTFIQYFFNAEGLYKIFNIVELNFGYQIFVFSGCCLMTFSILNKDINNKYDIYGKKIEDIDNKKVNNDFGIMFGIIVGFTAMPIIKMMDYNSVISIDNVAIIIKNVFFATAISSLFYFFNKNFIKSSLKNASIYVFVVSSLISINELVLVRNSIFLMAVCSFNYIGLIMMDKILTKLRIYDNFSLIKVFFFPSIISVVMTSIVGYSDILSQFIGVMVVMFFALVVSLCVKYFVLKH